LRSKSYLFLALVLGLGILSAIGYHFTEYRYGLDIRGGIRFTYQLDTSELTPEQREGFGRIRERLISIMTNRAVGPLGVTEPTVIAKGIDQIIIELPGMTDEAQAREVIGSSARIEFYHARNVVTRYNNFRPYDIAAGGDERGEPSVSFVRRTTSEPIEPGTPEYAEMIAGWTLILAGEDLAEAAPQASGDSYVPIMHFSPEGARKMETWSRQWRDQGENIAAVLDGRVLSIAALRDGTILRDNAVIEGRFDPEYVRRLTEMLNAGALPVDLIPLSSERVDPTIGNHALELMVMAGLAAFAVISVFLLVYYGFPGFVALIALMLYVLFTLTALKLINATFSLAAIAGFVLSVGMAVDANILVFERLKEELKRGKSLGGAINLAFKRALPAIVDSNACTVLTCLVLMNLGTGPVKGFATTLLLGVIISLLTAVFITRSIMLFAVGAGLDNPKWFALNRNWFGEKFEAQADQKPLQIVQNYKKWFILSALPIIPGLIFISMGGLKPNVEFRGGFEAVYSVPEAAVTPATLTRDLAASGYPGANVKFGVAADEQGVEQRLAYITLPSLPQLEEAGAQAPVLIAEAANLAPETNLGFTQIGPAVQQETIRNAILGVLISCALIVIYLTIRFGVALGGIVGGLRFGLSAIGALVHDILMVVSIAGIVGYFLGWEVSALFITAMLTVIGFSVHDSIVIFDRIRENLRLPQRGEDIGNLMNRSVTQSFARSINTSATTAVALAILMLFGTATPDLRFFVLAMLVGMISGTYSSIYNAAPILYLWDRAVTRRRGAEQGLVGMAAAENERARIVSTQVAPEPELVTTGGRTYGQVRRRANEPKKGHIEIDEDER
jgi:SecD/SecF fusion protein